MDVVKLFPWNISFKKIPRGWKITFFIFFLKGSNINMYWITIIHIAIHASIIGKHISQKDFAVRPSDISLQNFNKKKIVTMFTTVCSLILWIFHYLNQRCHFSLHGGIQSEFNIMKHRMVQVDYSKFNKFEIVKKKDN